MTPEEYLRSRIQGPEFFSQFPPAGPAPGHVPLHVADESHLEHMMHSPGAPILSEADEFRGSGAEALSNMAALMTGRGAGGVTPGPRPMARPAPRPMARPMPRPAPQPTTPVPQPTPRVVPVSTGAGSSIGTRTASAATQRPEAVSAPSDRLNPFKDKNDPGVPSGPSETWPAIGRALRPPAQPTDHDRLNPYRGNMNTGMPSGPSATWPTLLALLARLVGPRERAQSSTRQYGFMPRQ